MIYNIQIYNRSSRCSKLKLILFIEPISLVLLHLTLFVSKQSNVMLSMQCNLPVSTGITNSHDVKSNQSKSLI